MAWSTSAFAYGAVAVTAAWLFAIGTPAERYQAAARQPIIQAAATETASPPTQPNTSGFSLHSLQVDFPASDRSFPGGSAADVVTANCTACHSPGMILTQPRLSAATWQQEVEKMRGTFKAPVDAAAVPAIVAYLATLPRQD